MDEAYGLNKQTTEEPCTPSPSTLHGDRSRRNIGLILATVIVLTAVLFFILGYAYGRSGNDPVVAKTTAHVSVVDELSTTSGISIGTVFEGN